jgi:exopolyphosphatase/guanosine-5'-triphosphate,3'-diphosphate pyrophosphatase
MTRWAAVDLGTNTFRLLIAEETAPGVLRQLELLQETVRVGEGIGKGVGATLAEAAKLRALACLDRFAGCMDRFGATRRLGVFTAAGRDLADGEEFLALAARRLGAELLVPSGEEEARLSFNGALSLLSQMPGDVLFLDIGGGSTEIVSRLDGKVEGLSLRTGVVRLAEEVPLSDPPTGEEHARILQRARDDLYPAAERFYAPAWRERFESATAGLVATAGTPLTVAAQVTGRPVRDTRALTGVRVSARQLEDMIQSYAALTKAQRAALPAVERGREDVILAGLALLAEFTKIFGAPDFIVCDGGVLEGALLDAVGRQRGSVVQWQWGDRK